MSQKKLKKQRSISPRKIKGGIPNQALYKSLETLSSIQVRHQRPDNQIYVQTLQRIKRQLESLEKKHIRGVEQVSVIQKKWIHKRFT